MLGNVKAGPLGTCPIERFKNAFDLVLVARIDVKRPPRDSLFKHRPEGGHQIWRQAKMEDRRAGWIRRASDMALNREKRG
jgi:hypothetical protein